MGFLEKEKKRRKSISTREIPEDSERKQKVKDGRAVMPRDRT